MHGGAVHRKLRFGPFELSIGERVLRRDRVVLSLGSRGLDIPVYLAERPGSATDTSQMSRDGATLSSAPSSRSQAIRRATRTGFGIPLAIEVAAGQVAALGIKNTASRLVSRLELLKLCHRTAAPRHRTLKATLDWSYNLLSDAERTVLRRIAPFVGHFTLEAAQRVAGESGFGSSEIVDAIAALFEKSLSETQLNEGQPQYRFLHTTRAYAFEKLEEHSPGADSR